MAKRPVPLYDFNAFGQAIKAARMERKESRKDVCDAMNLSPRYLANIENKGQQPSLQFFYELVTRYSISVDQFFFPNKDAEKNTQRRQLDALLDSMSDDGLEIVTATAQNAGTSLMRPVALVCIGGLLYATLMTLFVVPCMYEIISKKTIRIVDEAELELLED